MIDKMYNEDDSLQYFSLSPVCSVFLKESLKSQRFLLRKKLRITYPYFSKRIKKYFNFDIFFKILIRSDVKVI
jgi:hypothetical protein